jgi:hypothetical protein
LKSLYKYLLVSLFFIFYSCALDIPEDAFEYLAPPAITCRLSGVSGDPDIYIDFTGKNNEYYFDGYNVYVSDTAMLSASVTTYNRVYVDEPGYYEALPSYPLKPSGSQSGTIKVREYWVDNDLNNMNSFEPGTRYYIMLCSYHHLSPYVRQDGCSNQVSIIFNK